MLFVIKMVYMWFQIEPAFDECLTKGTTVPPITHCGVSLLQGDDRSIKANS